MWLSANGFLSNVDGGLELGMNLVAIRHRRSNRYQLQAILHHIKVLSTKCTLETPLKLEWRDFDREKNRQYK